MKGASSVTKKSFSVVYNNSCSLIEIVEPFTWVHLKNAACNRLTPFDFDDSTVCLVNTQNDTASAGELVDNLVYAIRRPDTHRAYFFSAENKFLFSCENPLFYGAFYVTAATKERKNETLNALRAAFVRVIEEEKDDDLALHVVYGMLRGCPESFPRPQHMKKKLCYLAGRCEDVKVLENVIDFLNE
jgi:hypothetical protein